MNKIKLSLLVILFSFLSAFTFHKFYVGVFQIDYFKEKKAVQITARLFIDDLEKALYKKHNKHIYITTKDEIAEANTLIANYLSEKLKIKINNKSQSLQFLTKEQEDNIVICYLKIPFKDNIKDLEITNTVLSDIFKEQQNLVHLNLNSNKKTLLFTNTETNQKLKYK
ncbi:DUF6702 family protein [Flavobacterium sp.]|jgi:predicted RNase H-related nuclease YkuK (DUF458 family)|uniref:DUF6702 family protein n=2 Tax=Flavobacterium sp. TaxID=239 RepID=UPI001B48C578|nr:DUF6702 family protein [Flavobacterium sp.]MBP6126917.1 hypothetical protein [Flavobacterium sp.]